MADLSTPSFFLGLDSAAGSNIIKLLFKLSNKVQRMFKMQVKVFVYRLWLHEKNSKAVVIGLLEKYCTKKEANYFCTFRPGFFR